MHSRTRARRRVLAVLGITLALGVVSVPLARQIGEPYPWLIMPGFEGTGGFDGQVVRITEPTFTFHLRDEATRTLSAPQLFAGVSHSYLPRLAGRFAPVGRPPRFAHLVPTRVFPGYGAGSKPLLPHDPALLRWFEQRARAYYPDADVLAVTVAQRRRTIDPTGATRFEALPELDQRFSP
jgi:hypothetical protein